jgi:hypothetical protein
MNFSLRSGGEASSLVGEYFLGSLPLVLFDMCVRSPRFPAKMPAYSHPHKTTVVHFQRCWKVLDATAVIMLCRAIASLDHEP